MRVSLIILISFLFFALPSAFAQQTPQIPCGCNIALAEAAANLGCDSPKGKYHCRIDTSKKNTCTKEACNDPTKTPVCYYICEHPCYPGGFATRCTDTMKSDY